MQHMSRRCAVKKEKVGGQTDTQTHKHTDTQTHRHTDTQTDRQTDRQTDGLKGYRELKEYKTLTLIKCK